MAFPRCFLFILFTILMAIARITIAGRDIPATDAAKDTDVKKPECFFDHDGSVLIPGVGRVMVPKHGLPTMPGIIGSGGGGGSSGSNGGYDGTGAGGASGGDDSTGAGGANGSYIPGGDDTSIPNPGYEVPNPAGGAVPTPTLP